MSALQRIIACTIAGILWLGAIIAKHFWPDIETGAFMAACGAVITALGIHGATVGGSGDAPAAAPAPSAQGGFARLPFLLLVVSIAALIGLAGCTTTTASIYSGLYTQAKAGIQTFDDNTLATMKDLVCAQPYSAIQRHPELQPGIAALCGPMTNTASLDPAQVMQMLSIAKQLGIAPAAAPAAKP